MKTAERCKFARLAPLLVCVLATTIAIPVRAADNGGDANRSAGHDARHRHLSLADHRLQWPTREHLVRVLTLQDYNTRVVLAGTTLLGVCAGVVGVFALLRKRSLAGDVIGHASLPGIAVAFLVMERLSPGAGRNLPGLLAGATVSGMAGMLCMTLILRYTRIKEDAALAIVLGVFFGLGMVLFTILQNIPSGNTAGLNKFIFGTAASLLASDVRLIAQAAIVVLALAALLFKELGLVCFDEGYARAQGWPTALLDLVLLALVVAVVEIGAQSVGLILVVGLLILPAAAARFWTEDLLAMTFASAAIGGASAGLGVLVSALAPRLAAGAVIILVGGVFFAVSMCFGKRRGVVWRLVDHRRLARRVGRHDLLRAFYEATEPRQAASSAAEALDSVRPAASFDVLLAMRSWSPSRLARLLRSARRAGLVEPHNGSFQLTASGAEQARRAARNHRLWEQYLVQYADIAPSHVDRDADQIEHILDPALIDELERLLAGDRSQPAVPASLHAIDRGEVVKTLSGAG